MSLEVWETWWAWIFTRTTLLVPFQTTWPTLKNYVSCMACLPLSHIFNQRDLSKSVSILFLHLEFTIFLSHIKWWQIMHRLFQFQHLKYTLSTCLKEVSFYIITWNRCLYKLPTNYYSTHLPHLLLSDCLLYCLVTLLF